MSSVQLYSFPLLVKAECESIRGTPDTVVRVSKLITTVSAPELCVITGLFIGKVNQLVMPVDAWQYAALHSQRIRTEFLKEHGLLGKSWDEVDDYLDDNELSIPDPCRIDLGTIGPNVEVCITGEFKETFCATFIGYART